MVHTKYGIYEFRIQETGTLYIMVIVHCAETIKGGIASYLRDLVPSQTSQSPIDQVLVIIPESQKSELPTDWAAKTIYYTDRYSRLVNSFFLVKRTLESIPHRGDVILHCHSTFAGAIVRPILRIMRPRIKQVYCSHGWAWERDTKELNKCLIRFLEKCGSLFCDFIVCISRHDLKEALSVHMPYHKLKLVLNGISMSTPDAVPARLDCSPRLLRLLFVGRLDRQKGVDVFCAALDMLEDVAVGSIVGASVVESDPLLQTPPNVSFTGWVSPEEVQGWLEWADALVIPSRWEGFGLVALEAMRTKVAVIASSVGGLTEIVVDEKTGYLVPPGDAESIAIRVKLLDRQTLLQLGEAGYQRFLTFFTIDRVANQILDIYQEVMKV